MGYINAVYSEKALRRLFARRRRRSFGEIVEESIRLAGNNTICYADRSATDEASQNARLTFFSLALEQLLYRYERLGVITKIFSISNCTYLIADLEHDGTDCSAYRACCDLVSDKGIPVWFGCGPNGFQENPQWDQHLENLYFLTGDEDTFDFDAMYLAHKDFLTTPPVPTGFDL